MLQNVLLDDDSAAPQKMRLFFLASARSLVEFIVFLICIKMEKQAYRFKA
jgi:hypothetical protein